MSGAGQTVSEDVQEALASLPVSGSERVLLARSGHLASVILSPSPPFVQVSVLSTSFPWDLDALSSLNSAFSGLSSCLASNNSIFSQL